MKILLPIINFILALILVFILVYPEIQAKKVVEAQFYQVKSSVDNPQTALITLKKKRIRTLKDLKTKRKIGYYKDSKIKQIIKYILSEMGIDPEIHSYIPLSLKEMQTALEENIVDVLVAVEPVRSELLKKNGIKIVDDGFIEKILRDRRYYSVCEYTLLRKVFRNRPC